MNLIGLFKDLRNQKYKVYDSLVVVKEVTKKVEEVTKKSRRSRHLNGA